MALTRRSTNRVSSTIWPGFVDAMTALLLVLMFVLTIFMIVQFILRETISGQESELDSLAAEVNSLALALGLEQQNVAALEDERGRLNATLDEARETAEQQSTLIAALQGQVADQETALAERDARITSFEAQVASLLAERDDARAEIGVLEGERDRLVTEQEALQLAIAQARDEIDAQTEAARLAAARRQALDALIADLRSRVSDRETSLAAALASLEAAEAQAATSEEARLAELAAAEELRARLADTEATLSEEEQARLAEAAAAEALRERLRNADAELTAMTLALEEQRRRAEETLTLLAAARVAEENLTERLAAALAAQEQGAAALADIRAELATLREVAGSEEALRDQLAAALAARAAAEAEATRTLSEAEERAALLATANAALADERALSAESQRRVQVLNEQVAELRTQLSSLQSLLDEASSRDAAAQVRIESLGSQLNVALARVASEERRRAALEEAERIRLEEEARRLAEEARNLESYRSEFFGALRAILGDVEGVQIVGDRFLFSSEVLFPSGSPELLPEGRAQIAQVARILSQVSAEIPEGIDWILRVDGHTDNIPVSGGAFADNWELSQARALSVVRFMVNQLGFPPERLAATGFGEYRPVNPANTSAARAENRRIELKLTER
jgi:chemotaxis protein MotB